MATDMAAYNDVPSLRSSRTFVRLYALVRFPHYMLGNLKRLCFVHRFLPRFRVVDQLPKLDDTAPSLPFHYNRKTEQEDLTPEQLKLLHRMVKELLL